MYALDSITDYHFDYNNNGYMKKDGRPVTHERVLKQIHHKIAYLNRGVNCENCQQVYFYKCNSPSNYKNWNNSDRLVCPGFNRADELAKISII